MRYEMRKLLRNPRTWIVYAFFVGSLLLFWGFAIMENSQTQQYEANRYQYMAYTANKRLHDLSRALMPQESQFLYEVHEVGKSISSAYEKGEVTEPEFVLLRQQWDELIMQAEEKGYPYTDFGYESTIDPSAFLKQDEACLKQKSALLSSSWQPDSVNLNMQWILCAGWLAIALFVLVLWMDIIGAEMDNGTAKIVFTSITPRKTIFRTKVLVSLGTVVMLNLTSVIILGGCGALCGFGNATYPYIVNQNIVSPSYIFGWGILWSLCGMIGLLGFFLWAFSWRLKTMDAFCVCLILLAAALKLGAWQMEQVLILPVWRIGMAIFALCGIGSIIFALHRLERKEIGS